MLVYIAIEVTADDQKATLTINPGMSEMYRPGTAGSVEEAKATHEVLGQAITFAKMINGPERMECKP